MYNHLEDTENVFVLAAHTFCSRVKATCRRGGAGAVHAIACPRVTHRTSCSPYSSRPLCLLYVYDGKMLLDEDADSALVIPQVVVLVDKDDSWLTSLCPSACRRKHIFSPNSGQE